MSLYSHVYLIILCIWVPALYWRRLWVILEIKQRKYFDSSQIWFLQSNSTVTLTILTNDENEFYLLLSIKTHGIKICRMLKMKTNFENAVEGSMDRIFATSKDNSIITSRYLIYKKYIYKYTYCSAPISLGTFT